MPVNRIKSAEHRDYSSLLYDELHRIQRKYNLNDIETYDLISKKKYSRESIPICIFSEHTLSSFEAIVKFLRENCYLNFREIGELLNRSKFTIAASYRSATIKHPSKYIIFSTDYDIPTEFISSRKYSVLESIVLFLKQKHNLRYKEISDLLQLNQRTVWTVYQRAKKKRLSMQE